MNNDNKTEIKINKREREAYKGNTGCLAACDGGRMIIEQGVDATTMVSW
jgi:hypothetical protein